MNDKTPEQRLASVRSFMSAQGIDAFIVPYADAYQSRNRPAEGANRLEWLTGFRGSAGSAIIEQGRACVFVDGRYTLSARSQVDCAHFKIIDEASGIRPEAWLPKGCILGYDPFLHTKAELDVFAKAGLVLMACTPNPVDAAWGDKGLPARKAIAHDVLYAGQSVAGKLDIVCDALKAAGAQACAITRPDSVSWLLNLRVPTLPVVPVVHGYVLLDAVAGSAVLYTDVDCSDGAILAAFGNRVSVSPLVALSQGVADAAARLKDWQVDDFNTPAFFRSRLEAAGATVTHAPDPVTWPKACKNNVEQAGIRQAHVRDGVALVRLLHAIDTTPRLTERDVEALVHAMRAKDAACFTYSFEPIVGFNANGAYVHGQVPDEMVKTIEGDGLLLIDSGGQYLNGTTDVTRTLAIGSPSPEMKRAFTAVMRGHIALTRAAFPEGTSGGQLDVLARTPLWDMGYDYSHGTGHGVGYCLNVHEGPCNISPKVLRAAEPLKAGMLLSVEPGVYLEGKFGIRLENLCLVVPAQAGFLKFEPVTLAPFDRRALDLAALRDDEKAWLDDYHARVLHTLSPLLEPSVAQWLAGMCAPL